MQRKKIFINGIEVYFKKYTDDCLCSKLDKYKVGGGFWWRYNKNQKLLPSTLAIVFLST